MKQFKKWIRIQKTIRISIIYLFIPNELCINLQISIYALLSICYNRIVFIRIYFILVNVFI